MKKSLIKLMLVGLSASTLLTVSPVAPNVWAQDDEETTQTEETTEAEEETEAEETDSEDTEEETEAEDTTQASDEEEAEEETSEVSDLGLTLINKTELAEANGKDGNPAYVAVFGLVYDVTDVEAWENGEHNGLEAGTEASAAFLEDSPHAQDLLNDLKVVGQYSDWELTTEELAEYGSDNEATPNLIAVRGIVYNITTHPAWEDGAHNDIEAGNDITEDFAGSPHEDELLADLVAVGRHIDYVFTEEELAEFDGQNGQPAYVAVDGVVYDVSSFGAWEGGEHNGVKAGTDASDAFSDDSPHDEELLEDLPIAGKYE